MNSAPGCKASSPLLGLPIAMEMALRPLVPVLFLGLVLLTPPPLWATGRWARRLGEDCLSCHLDARGSGPLNDRGRRLAGEGHRQAFDPELTATGAPTPLSSGGALMVRRRYQALGERLFRMEDLGATRKACQDCHAGGQNLAPGFWASYPRPGPEGNRWISLRSAIDACLQERMGTPALRPGSRSQIALELYLRTLDPIQTEQ